MKKGTRVRFRMKVKRPGKPQHVGISERNQSATDDVQYFLNALHQISDALHTLGYPTEGNALAEVRVDLRRRLFGSSEKSVRALGVFH